MFKLGPFAPDIADYNESVSRVADNCVAIANGFRSIPNAFAPSPSGDTVMTGFVSGNYFTVQAHRIFNRTERSPDGEYMTLMAGIDTTGTDTPELWAASRLHSSTEFMQGSIGHPSVLSDDDWQETRCQFVDWGDEVFIFGDFRPQKITHGNISAALDDGGTTKTSDLGGTPPGARFAAKVGLHLVLGYVQESAVSYPFRVWWSASNNPEGWVSGTDLAGFEEGFFEEGGKITGVVGGEFGLIFQEKQITRMNFIGAPDVWQFDKVVENEGCHAPGSIVKVGSDVYYLSPGGWKVIRQGSVVEPIGANLVDEYFKENAGSFVEYFDWAKNISGVYDSVSGCIFWAWTSVDAASGAAGYNDRMMVFNTNLPPGQAWSTMTIDSICVFPLEPQRSSTSSENAEFGLGIVQVFSSNPYEFHLSYGTTTQTATIETGRFFKDGLKTYVSEARAHCDCTHLLTLLTQVDDGTDTEVLDGPTAVDAYGKVDFDTEGKYHRFRWVNTETWAKIAGITAKLVDAGEF